MVIQKRSLLLIAILIIGLPLVGFTTHSIDYKIINMKDVSRFTEDRIAYQHIEIDPTLNDINRTDNSLSTLLVIRDRKMYIFRDGYDNPKEVFQKRMDLLTRNQLIPDLWINKIDDSPDYVLITERRLKIMEQVVQQEINENYTLKENKNLTENYTKLYTEVRDNLIENHAANFRYLMVTDKESVSVERTPIPKRLSDKGPQKYMIKASAKTLNGTVYYAEDADGDGETETFTVSLNDGFHWGYKSGPNLLFIYKCRYKKPGTEEPKNEKIKSLIGTLTKEAYYGTTKEIKKIEDTLEKEKIEMTRMIDNLYQKIERSNGSTE